jgi:hypothetical protein
MHLASVGHHIFRETEAQPWEHVFNLEQVNMNRKNHGKEILLFRPDLLTQPMQIHTVETRT